MILPERQTSPQSPPRRLDLVPFGEIPEELLSWLGARLERCFRLPAARGEPLPLSEDWLDAERRQYDSDSLLDTLVQRFVADAPETGCVWSLGIVDADLYGGDRNFVFGQATIGGCCALVSLARLRPDGGDNGDDRVFRERALKEAVHELGHVAGLDHCDKPHCVMSASADVGATDAKSSDLCAACSRRLREHLRNGS